MNNSNNAGRPGFIVHEDDWKRISDRVEPSTLGSALVKVIGDSFSENPRDASGEIADFAERLIYGLLWDRNRRDHRQYERNVRYYCARKRADGAAAPPRFVKPTLEAVRDYCAEKGYSNVDPADFVDYYESNGWKVGKSPMKDWKRTVNRWHRNHDRGPAARPVGVVLQDGEDGHDEHAYEL